MYPCFPKVWVFYGVFFERVEADLEWDVESGRGLGGLGGGILKIFLTQIFFGYIPAIGVHGTTRLVVALFSYT